MPAPKIYKVFVSSTYDDLREERAEVQKALLKLNCLPVGMELFPAADDETWAFIKEQIDDSDYYVVLIAGRYGSLAPDGVSFTEKEYDYARSNDKPSIAFVHADRGQIQSSKVENDHVRLSQLDAFIAKVKSRPIRTFLNPHQLATEVVASFVDLMNRRPAVGFVRSDQIVDYKKYSEVLESNNTLQRTLDQLGNAQLLVPFTGHDQPIPVMLEVIVSSDDTADVAASATAKTQATTVEIQTTLGRLLLDITSDLIMAKDEHTILANLAQRLANRHRESVSVALEQARMPGKVLRIEIIGRYVAFIRRRLYALNLIEISVERRKRDRMTTQLLGEQEHDVAVWKFTPQGRNQLLILEGSQR